MRAKRLAMKRYVAGVVVLLLAGLLVSCGGGDGGTSGATGSAGAGGGGGSGSSGNAGGGNTVTLPAAGARVEGFDAAVTLSGAWTRSDSSLGWIGDSAMQSTAAGATASFTFVGTSVRWIGSRGRGMGIASVRVDGGPAREVDLFARPADEVHTEVITISDLSPGQHTLTVEVTGRANTEAQSNVVVVDAFDVQPETTISHWQDTDPNARFSAGWTKSGGGFPWGG